VQIAFVVIYRAIPSSHDKVDLEGTRGWLGAWPSPEQLLERLITALDSSADDDTRAPEERSKF
jgi:hypothetical protein